MWNLLQIDRSSELKSLALRPFSSDGSGLDDACMLLSQVAALLFPQRIQAQTHWGVVSKVLILGNFRTCSTLDQIALARTCLFLFSGLPPLASSFAWLGVTLLRFLVVVNLLCP